MASICEMTPKNVLITGGTDGIGREAALQFASQGHNVTISGRNEQKANEVIETAINKYQAKIRYIQVDQSSMSQTAAFAQKIASEKFDIYIMNAGIMNPEQTRTEDGFDRTLMTNLVSTYMIVDEILNKRTNNRKIHFVFVTSVLMKFYSSTPFAPKLFNPKKVQDWERAMVAGDKSGPGKYAISKIGQATLAAIVNRLNLNGVSATSVHPGCVMTNMMRSLPARQQFYLKLCKPFITTKEAAGANIVKAALSPLPCNMYYLTSKEVKLPSIIQSAKTISAFSTFFEKYSNNTVAYN